ncbi:MAG: arylesterase [Planctomycetota bacterium]
MKPRIALALTLAFAAAACGGDSSAPAPPAEIGGGMAEIDLPETETVQVPEGSPTVVFLGDSLTAGLHLTPDLAFPAELQRRLVESGDPFELVNAGASGDTSRGGVTRLPWLLRNADPDVVVVELGANDGLRGVKLSATEDNLREILAAVRDAGARPLLVGMNVPANLGEYADDFAALYPRLAEELDVPLVARFLDGVGGVPEMNLEDGMHPNPEGHVRLAANVEDALRAVLRSLP